MQISSLTNLFASIKIYTNFSSSPHIYLYKPTQMKKSRIKEIILEELTKILNEEMVSGVNYDADVAAELKAIVGDLHKLAPYILEIGNKVASDSTGTILIYEDGKLVKKFKDVDALIKGVGYQRKLDEYAPMNRVPGAGTGGGGRRFIPSTFTFPASARAFFKDHIKVFGDTIYISTLLANALGYIERGRSSYEKTQNYPELTKLVQDKLPSNIRGVLKKYIVGSKQTNIAGKDYLPVNIVDRDGNKIEVYKLENGDYQFKNPGALFEETFGLTENEVKALKNGEQIVLGAGYGKFDKGEKVTIVSKNNAGDQFKITIKNDKGVKDTLLFDKDDEI